MSAEGTTTDLRAEATRLLGDLTGRPDARLRDGQFEAIEALVAHRSRVLVVQRTGWGKSAVYFLAAKLMRQAGRGPSLIVSPLLALMRDQVAAASRAGVVARTLNSANVTEWGAVEDELARGEVDVLLVSPERLTNPAFRDGVLPRILGSIGMIVVDEAHCISDWGHDFRPDYRRIGAMIRELPADTPVLATTATANSRVVADVAEQLGDDTLVVRGPLARDSLRLGVFPTRPPAERIAWLADHLGDFAGSGIVYALTVSAAEDTTRALRDAGWDVATYTGSTDAEERERLEQALKDDALKALVATSALGMGFDKPDLGFVVHLGAPSSPVAYYQQVGRAGRAAESADVLLLPGTEDEDIWEYFATASMPSEEDAEAVLAALDAEGPLSIPALETRVGVRRARLDLLLKTLSVDGAVRRVRGGYEATGAGWRYDAERYAHVREVRRAEARAMLDYESGPTCRMRFLTEALDDPDPRDCGRCDRCAGTWWSEEIGAEAQKRAREVLGGVGVPIEPRAQWPTGMANLGVSLSGRLPADERAEEGRAVARLTDLGAGQRLRAFLAPDAPDAPIPDDIGALCLETLGGWSWERRPDSVVAVPSRRRPATVRSLASGLAAAGRLDDLGDLALVGDPGGPDVNSAFRLRAVHDAFALTPEQADAVRGRVVLLVDDLVVSRWTLTVCARALRRAGADAVLPFALAVRG
ncbi:RecQ family ATP-dependent DNA helicase [Microbacterium sp. gxy059]|uniref:RecQ family ATP-dependent DNA helicase n=1 Tax=Microbacterium sp. gxy059 TaxID=2957199 RepID=UPI003D96A0B6